MLFISIKAVALAVATAGMIAAAVPQQKRCEGSGCSNHEIARNYFGSRAPLPNADAILKARQAPTDEKPPRKRQTASSVSMMMSLPTKRAMQNAEAIIKARQAGKYAQAPRKRQAASSVSLVPRATAAPSM